MIIEGICNVFFGVIGFIVGLFPKFPSFEALNVSLAPLFYVIKFVNLFISVKVIGGCLLILLVIYNSKFVWSIMMWLVKKIPGVS